MTQSLDALQRWMLAAITHPAGVRAGDGDSQLGRSPSFPAGSSRRPSAWRSIECLLCPPVGGAARAVSLPAICRGRRSCSTGSPWSICRPTRRPATRCIAWPTSSPSFSKPRGRREDDPGLRRGPGPAGARDRPGLRRPGTRTGVGSLRGEGSGMVATSTRDRLPTPWRSALCPRLSPAGIPLSRQFATSPPGKPARSPSGRQPGQQHVALLRRDYIVRRHELTAMQFDLLSHLAAGHSLERVAGRDRPALLLDRRAGGRRRAAGSRTGRPPAFFKLPSSYFSSGILLPVRLPVQCRRNELLPGHFLAVRSRPGSIGPS